MLDEIQLLKQRFRSRQVFALFDTVPVDAAGATAALTLAGDRISSSAELSETLRAAFAAGLSDSDGFFHALSRISSSMEKRRVLIALVEKSDLNPSRQLDFLTAAAEIESNAECAAVLNAFVDRYPVADQVIREALLAALETVDSEAERDRLLTRLQASSSR